MRKGKATKQHMAWVRSHKGKGLTMSRNRVHPDNNIPTATSFAQIIPDNNVRPLTFHGELNRLANQYIRQQRRNRGHR